MGRELPRDLLKQAASAQSERAFAKFFDTAASNLELEIIGDANCMSLLNKLLATVNVNYRNLPSILLEIDRILKKYGAQTVDEAEAEQRKLDAENEAAESEGEGEEGEEDSGDKGDGTIDDGQAFVKDEDE